MKDIPCQLNLIVKGRVQGVFYRAFCVEIAKELGLSGWVTNRSDGNVEILAQGQKSVLEKFIEKAQKGPENARVSEIEVRYEALIKKLDGFAVKR